MIQSKFMSVVLTTLLFLTPTSLVLSADSNSHDSLLVSEIVAKTSIGDYGRVANAFEINVNDSSLVSDVDASDFSGADIIGLDVDENKIIVTVTPFSYDNDEWEIENARYSELTFSLEDVTSITTRTLDDVIRGSFTYAGMTREYGLYLPKDEEGNTIKNVPLVIWNHGGGEYNIELEKSLAVNRGITAWPENGYETAVLMVQVANPNYAYFAAFDEEKKKLIDQNNALQAALVRELISDGYVDENRVYVTGASSGGGATMRFLLQYPQLFAGAIPICSMDPIVWVHGNQQDSYETIVENFEAAFKGQVYTWDEESNAMISKDIDTEALLDVPIFFTHAANDLVTNRISSEAMYEAMGNIGDTNNKIAIWTNEEMAEYGIGTGIDEAYVGYLLHLSWIRVFNDNTEGSSMKWLFAQTKQKAAEPIKEQPSYPIDNILPDISVTGGIIKVKPTSYENGKARVQLSSETVRLALEQTTGNTLNIQVDSDNVNEVVVNIPVDQLTKSSIQYIEVGSNLAALTLPTNLQHKDSSSNTTITVSVARSSDRPATTQEHLSGTELYDINLWINNEKVSELNGKRMIVIKAPYELQTGELPNQIIPYFIDKDGELMAVSNGKYNAATGMLEFKIKQLGKYTIKYADVSFIDVKAEWAKEAVESLAARGIMLGEAGKFNPDGIMTRAEFIAMLMNIFEFTEENLSTTLSDVKGDSTYDNEIATAQRLGIINGRLDGSFGRHDEVTRQDMAVMTYRALVYSGVKVEEKVSLEFTDLEKASPYALEAIHALQSYGILNGTGKGGFAPLTNTTRAQAAVIIYKIMSLV